jgi:hypothetical protein
MDKYGVSKEDVDLLVKTGQATDEQDALEKVAAGNVGSTSKKIDGGKSGKERSKQTDGENKQGAEGRGEDTTD